MKRSSTVLISLGLTIGIVVSGLFLTQFLSPFTTDSSITRICGTEPNVGCELAQLETEEYPITVIECHKAENLMYGVGMYYDYKILVMSPLGDLGCLYWSTAIELTSQGWIILENNPIEYPRYVEYLKDDVVDTKPSTEAMNRFGHAITLDLPHLPVAGQDATVFLNVVPGSAVPTRNVDFDVSFIGNVNVSSSDPRVRSDGYPFQDYLATSMRTTSVPLVSGEALQFNFTITPVAATNIHIQAVGIDSSGSIVTDVGQIYLLIGDQESELGGMYWREPGQDYVWTERPHSQCWTPPWYRQGQSVHDYFADMGITVLDSRDGLPAVSSCEGCGCLGGSHMFLTHESDYGKIPIIYSGR